MRLCKSVAYWHTSRYRVPAVLPPQAFRAVQSHPDLVELLHGLAHQLRQYREERKRAVPDFHVEVFDVRRANPQRLPDGGHAGEDEVVVVSVGNVGGWHNLDNCKNQLQI